MTKKRNCKHCGEYSGKRKVCKRCKDLAPYNTMAKGPGSMPFSRQEKIDKMKKKRKNRI